MTDKIVRRRPQVALEPVPFEAGCSKDLITVFLARYSTPASRRAALGGIRRSARILGAREADIRWWELSVTHMAALRLGLAERTGVATAQQSLAITRSLLRECWRQGLLERDTLARLVDVPAIAGTRMKRGRMLDPIEIRAIKGALERSAGIFEGARAGAIFALGYGCGLRREEISRARFEDLGLDAGQLRIIGKGNKERLVPVPEGARHLLRVWAGHRGAFPGPIVCRRTGNRAVPLTVAQIARELGKLLEAARIRDVTPHDLRRTYGSGLLGEGIDLSTVQSLMGHANPQTTAGYDVRPAAARARAVEKLPGLGHEEKPE